MTVLCVLVIIAFILLSLRYPWWFPRTWHSMPVIMYHHAGTPPMDDPPTQKQIDEELTYLEPATMEAQIQKIRAMGFNFINLDDLAQEKLPPHPLMLTFDDGHQDNFTVVFPLLQKYQAKATIFLSTDYIDHDPTYLTWEQVKLMDQSPLINFGSHTCSHTRLRHLPNDRIVYELTASKRLIEEKLGHEINAFAYPYGSGAYDQRIRSQVLAAGYRYDFSTRPGRASLPLSSRRPIARIYPKRYQTAADFTAQLRWGRRRIC